MKKWCKLIAIAAVVLAVVGAVSCAKPAVTPAEMKVIKVGGADILSGPGAAAGIPWMRGGETAAKLIEEVGGIKVGGETYKLEIIWEDNEYSGEAGVTAAEKLVYRDKVKYVVGLHNTLTAKAMQPIYDENNVLWLMGGSANAPLTGTEHPLCFFTHQPNEALLLGLLMYAQKEHPELRTMSLLNRNDATGEMNRTQVIEALEGFPQYEVVADERFELGTENYYPIITRLLTPNPDIVNLGGIIQPEWCMLVKQLRERGFSGLIVNLIPTPENMVLELVGAEAAEGTIVSGLWTGRGLGARPGLGEFVQKYVELFGEGTYNPIALFGSEQIDILAQAMEAANSLDPVEIAKVMPTMTFNTQMGEGRYVGKSRFGVDASFVTPAVIDKFTNGCWEVVMVVEVDELMKYMWK